MAKTAELQKISEQKSVVVWKDYSASIANVIKTVRTVEQALAMAMKGDVPTIRRMVGEVGEEQTAAFICKLLIDLSDFLQLSKPLTESHIMFIAETILAEFKMVTVADIEVVIKRIKSGHYGELYERLDSAKFLKYIRGYLEERIDAAMTANDREVNEFKQNTLGVFDTFQTGYDKLSGKITYRKKDV